MIFSWLSKGAIAITKAKEAVDLLQENVEDRLKKFDNRTAEERGIDDALERQFYQGENKEERKQRKRKQARWRRKLLLVFLHIIDFLLTLVDVILTFVITHFVLILCILLILVILLSIFLPIITETFAPNILNTPNTVITEEADQGSSLERTAWSEYELLVRGVNLTGHQKNLYRLISLFKEYETNYDTLDLKLTFGMGVSESSYRFFTNVNDNAQKSILEYPITDLISGYLKDSSNGVAGFGGLFGMDLANLNFPTNSYKIDKSKYKPKAGLTYLTDYDRQLLSNGGKTEEDLLEDAFAPYAVQKILEINETYWKQENVDKFRGYAEQALDAVNLSKSDDNMRLIMELSAVRRSLDNSTQYELPCYYFNAMLMKAAADESGNVDLTRWGTTDTAEPSMRKKIIGTLKDDITSISSVDDFVMTSTGFTLKGSPLGCTMWQYFKKNWGTTDWWATLESQFVADYNNALVVTDGNVTITWKVQWANIYHFAFTRYIGAENIINDIVSNLVGASFDNPSTPGEFSDFGINAVLSLETFAFPLIEYRGVNNVQAGITCGTFFGFDYLAQENRCRFHKGTDISVATSNEVKIASAGEGVVIEVVRGWTPPAGCDYNTGNKEGWGRGNCVVIEHTNGWKSVYMHLKEVESSIEVGTRVSSNTVIGYMGNTGESYGRHLHWQLEKTDGTTYTYLNPNVVCIQLYNIQLTSYGAIQVKNKADWDANKWPSALFNEDFKPKNANIIWTI